MPAGPNVESIGSSLAHKSPCATGAHNFRRNYFYHLGTGDVRATYEDLYFNSTGSGETIRVRGIANGTGVAAAGTINAIHATGRVASGKTVSGSLNAIRATLEVAGTTPTPGGKLAALRIDSNIVTGWTAGANDAFISVGNNGAGLLTNFIAFDDAIANDSIIATHTTQTNTHSIKINVAGTTYYIPIHANATGRGTG